MSSVSESNTEGHLIMSERVSLHFKEKINLLSLMCFDLPKAPFLYPRLPGHEKIFGMHHTDWRACCPGEPHLHGQVMQAQPGLGVKTGGKCFGWPLSLQVQQQGKGQH